MTLPVNISVFGLGGSGGNTVTRFMERINIQQYGESVRTVIANTDALAVEKATAQHKLVIGQNITHGQGAGSQPLFGKLAAEESLEEVMKLIGHPDLTLLTCGLGGGTGTGSLPVVANGLRKKYPDMLVVSLVTIPFKDEGITRMANAMIGLREIYDLSDATVVNSNDILIQLCPRLSLTSAFKVQDRIISDFIEGIIRLVTIAGIFNVDFADFKTVTRNSGFAHIGFGKGSTAEEAVETAMDNRLLDYDFKMAKAVLLNLEVPKHEEVEKIHKISGKIAQKYKIKNIRFGLKLLDISHPKAMVVFAGINSGMTRQLCGTPIRR